MPLTNDISLRRLTDILREVADCHSMINGFEVGEEAARGYSDDDEAGTKGELAYPYLWVDYDSAAYEIGEGRHLSSKLYTMRLFVADKQYENIKSDKDIMSDTEGILSDVVQYLLTSPALKKVIIAQGSVTAIPAVDATKDGVYGWILTLPIKVAYHFCHKDIPVVSKP